MTNFGTVKSWFDSCHI